MALEHLLAVLERDAEARSKSLLEEARGEAASIAAESASRLARRRADFVAGREAELRASSRHVVAEARREARRKVLEARHRLLDRVFAAAAERLTSPPYPPLPSPLPQPGEGGKQILRCAQNDNVILSVSEGSGWGRPSPGWGRGDGRGDGGEVQTSLVAEVLSYLGDAPAALRCHPALEPAVRRIVEGRPEISVVADPSLGPGLWAEAADGSLAVDGTLAGRLRRRRPALSLDVLRELEEAP